ncbi:hypothetical protein ACFONG_15840 [Uliginosibacterium paludis]|uniref:Uncharacterized protein n=1 Tax=Uliginosibacterium paludis TaxID=1615952 RepID=A0ABV2CUL0_9RHOO
MKETELLSLAKHSGERESWPLRTMLLANGSATSLTLPGYSLLRQFEIAPGYLVVTDEDCPFEESTHFIILNKNLTKILSERSIFRPYESFQLASIEWIHEHRFTAMFQRHPETWDFTIRNWSIPFLFPLLKIDRRSARGA